MWDTAEYPQLEGENLKGDQKFSFHHARCKTIPEPYCIVFEVHSYIDQTVDLFLFYWVS